MRYPSPRRLGSRLGPFELGGSHGWETWWCVSKGELFGVCVDVVLRCGAVLVARMYAICWANSNCGWQGAVHEDRLAFLVC